MNYKMPKKKIKYYIYNFKDYKHNNLKRHKNNLIKAK